jgi:hypothetical protein
LTTVKSSRIATQPGATDFARDVSFGRQQCSWLHDPATCIGWAKPSGLGPKKPRAPASELDFRQKDRAAFKIYTQKTRYFFPAIKMKRGLK